MDTVSFEDENRTNAELYNALSQGDDVKVFEMCRGLRNGPFHILTIHHDTVLHMATYCKRNNLVVALLRSLPETQFENLTWINSSGNTILHETSTNNGTVEAAAEMLRRAPSLLTMTNGGGETPLFRAARHGKTRIFKFLNDEVKKAIQRGVDMQTFLLRNDKATILHISIIGQNFDLAILIAHTYPVLIGKEDGDGLTSLQLLACNPSAFNNGVGTDFFKKLIYQYIDSSPERTSRVPMLQEIRMNKHRCESAKELARILIENDKSWKTTESRSDQGREKFHKYKGNITSVTDRGDIAILPSTPLLLATKYGCIEIVKEILKVYPQAVEHIDDDGRNILHLAIKYRRKEIIDTLIDMEHPIRLLGGKIDKKGNSLLHMVGVKGNDLRGEDDIRSPALVLRDDLILFEQMREKLKKAKEAVLPRCDKIIVEEGGIPPLSKLLKEASSPESQIAAAIALFNLGNNQERARLISDELGVSSIVQAFGRKSPIRVRIAIAKLIGRMSEFDLVSQEGFGRENVIRPLVTMLSFETFVDDDKLESVRSVLDKGKPRDYEAGSSSWLLERKERESESP
ncbi:hypothetical protein L6452_35257 [Arctium lappa]|uniref:Uncharacterized protein n=1 Tax=Arctium lappa TaxID=4217 RepID=A0ACB8Y5Z3_ARCLA|nr:hypothetical protein L6452_35257 [Arctium lappa]